MNRKNINIVSLILALFLLSGCSSNSGGPSSVPTQAPSSAVASAVTSPTVPSSVSETSTPASSSSPAPSESEATTPSPEPSPTQASEPQPYTVAWLNKYAPGSVASYEEQVGDNGDGDPASYPPANTYKLVVDLNNQCVSAYTKGPDENYSQLVRVMLCTTGNKENATGTGTYELGSDRNRFSLFNEFDCYAQYWTELVGDIYFHSVLYYKQDAKTLIESSYRDLGKPVSHGCIRLFVPDARWIYQNCSPGTVCQLTKDIPVNKQLQTALKKGHAGAVDYIPPQK
jgi:lipoprotein-anchoring transpeptidase ErfK/SrfK